MAKDAQGLLPSKPAIFLLLRVWPDCLLLTRDFLNASVTLQTTSGHLLRPGPCWGLGVRASSPLVSVPEQLCPESSGCIHKPSTYGLHRVLGGLEEGPLAARATGRSLGTEEPELAEQGELQGGQQMAELTDEQEAGPETERSPQGQMAGPWASSRSWRFILRALGAALQGLGAHMGIVAWPSLQGMDGRPVPPSTEVVTEATAGHEAGHRERCACPVLVSCPAGTRRSRRPLSRLCRWSQVTLPGGQRAVASVAI